MRASLKRNLLVGFGVSLLLLIISSVASYVSINKMDDSAALVDHTNKVIIQLENVISFLKDAETGQRGYLLTGKSNFLDSYIGKKGRAIEYIDSVRSLTIDNPAQTKSCDSLSEVVTKRMNFLQLTIEHKQNFNEIDTALLDTGKMYMDVVRHTINYMEAREKTLLEARVGQQERYTTSTRIIIVIAALLAILITVFFYMKVTSDFEQKEKMRKELEDKDADITRRINIIQGIAEKISAGDYTVRANDEGSDGLGSLSYSINKMAGSLGYSFNLLSDKEWMQTGIAGLNDQMLGEKDVETLTQDIIDFLANYTGSNVGTFYIKEDSNHLKLYSGYAWAATDKRRYINAGEGIPGQVAASGKAVIVRDIPNESIYISYAAGEIKPVEIMALPVFDGRIIKGVIELGKLKPFTEREVEFLNAVSHNIGIAVNSTQNRRKLQELLEETQSQAEELQAQHSELEGLNTELEMQTQKLQASDEELRVQQEELLQSNQELEERTRLIEEKNQLIVQRNIEIQAKAEELALSTKYKSEFLAKMSHELRTPLNSILLLSRLLSENNEQNLSTDQVEYARVIQSSGKGLLSLIDEILDLSKIESGKMDLEYTQINLREITNDMATLFKPVAAEKNIELNIHVEEDVPAFIETDKLRLEQIVRNLLSNALKFTSRGFVSLNIANTFDKKDYITITVKDTGIGIPKDKQQLIFEAFQQADGSTRRRYGGTGLGLSISRQLAKLLKGDIELNSAEGKGSEFILTIPATKQAANVTADKTSVEITPLPEKLDVTKIENPYITTVIPENIPDDRSSIKASDKNILIIEDDVAFAKSLLEFSRSRGYKGIVAVRGDEGIELAKKFKPQGILLDVQLPVKSGWEVMDELKGDVQTRHIPVHIMSSLEVRKESLLKGAVDFINKPMAFEQMKEVFEKIEYVLNRESKKVLIVEENSRHANALAYFLETYNINTEVKENVPGGIEALQKDDVDCVILDMGIPGQKSYETLDAVKKTPGLEHLPIIIFTGKSLSQAEEMRIKQYADSIVVKTAHSYQRILDEVSIFMHLVEENNKKAAVPSTSSPQKKLGALNEILKNKTVLIADDDIRNIFSLTKSLEKYEMNVLTAVDGKDALNQLKENPNVDVILMDMMMPEMDGYETTAKIKRVPSLKNIPVIAVTAKAMTGDREKCLSSGASDYITKPIDIDQLLSLLRVWLYEKSVK